jgi:hypothetical protein
MHKLAIVALFILLVPAAFAIVAQTHDVVMQSNLITQGYSFARVQGFNQNNAAVSIDHWHARIELAQSFAFCELQPAVLPPGPFDVEIALQCQTRSGFTTLFPSGTRIKIETFVPEGLTQPFRVEKLTIITGPRLPTPFPVTPEPGRLVPYVILEEQAGSAGTFMFFAGMGAIVILTLAIMLASRRQED